MKYSWCLVLCLILLVVACKKEPVEPSNNNVLLHSATDTLGCPTITSPDTLLQTLVAWSELRYMMPHFNPNNNDEFLFVDQIYQSPYAKLCVHDITTGETQIILEGQTFLTQPRWHANGWILFRGNGDNIYRIKSNGDSLTQMTTSNMFQLPVWRPDGQAWISNNAVNFAGDIDVFDLDGNLIEVIQGEEFFKGDWSDDNRIVTTKGYSGSNQFTWTDAGNLNWQDLTFDTNSPHKPAQDVHWIPMSDEVMYSQLWGDISRMNVISGEISQVREGCGGRHYAYFSINNNCSLILAERIQPDTIYTDGFYNYLIRKSEIVIMNFDGTNEQVINLP